MKNWILTLIVTAWTMSTSGAEGLVSLGEKTFVNEGYVGTDIEFVGNDHFFTDFGSANLSTLYYSLDAPLAPEWYTYSSFTLNVARSVCSAANGSAFGLVRHQGQSPSERRPVVEIYQPGSSLPVFEVTLNEIVDNSFGNNYCQFSDNGNSLFVAVIKGNTTTIKKYVRSGNTYLESNAWAASTFGGPGSVRFSDDGQRVMLVNVAYAYVFSLASSTPTVLFQQIFIGGTTTNGEGSTASDSLDRLAVLHQGDSAVKIYQAQGNSYQESLTIQPNFTNISGNSYMHATRAVISKGAQPVVAAVFRQGPVADIAAVVAYDATTGQQLLLKQYTRNGLNTPNSVPNSFTDIAISDDGGVIVASNQATEAGFVPGLVVFKRESNGTYSVFEEIDNYGGSVLNVDISSNGESIAVARRQGYSGNGFGNLIHQAYSISTDSGGPDPITPPQNVQATDGTFQDRVRVTWTHQQPTAVNHYEIYQTSSLVVPACSPGYRIQDNWNATSFDSTSVVPGTLYYYSVKAVANNGEEACSAINSGFADLPEQIAAPQNVQATDGTFQDRVRVTWTHPQPSDVNHYEIYQSTSAGIAACQPGFRVQDNWTSTSFTTTAVQPGTLYYFSIKAVADNGQEACSAIDTGFAEQPEVLAAPQNLVASDGEIGLINLSWTHPQLNDVDHFEVFQATSPSTPACYFASKILDNWTATSHQVTNAQPGTVYYYSVKAVGNDGQTACSLIDSGFAEEETSNEPVFEIKRFAVTTSSPTITAGVSKINEADFGLGPNQIVYLFTLSTSPTTTCGEGNVTYSDYKTRFKVPSSVIDQLGNQIWITAQARRLDTNEVTECTESKLGISTGN